jgi:hypothetical protein
MAVLPAVNANGTVTRRGVRSPPKAGRAARDIPIAENASSVESLLVIVCCFLSNGCKLLAGINRRSTAPGAHTPGKGVREGKSNRGFVVLLILGELRTYCIPRDRGCTRKTATDFRAESFIRLSSEPDLRQDRFRQGRRGDDFLRSGAVGRPGLVVLYFNTAVQPPCMIEVYPATPPEGQSEFSIQSIVTLLSPMLPRD